MEDTYGEGRVPVRSRLGIMRAGISEQFREIGFGAADRSPNETVRSGLLLVLCGWAFFVAAGTAFAKMTEHWDGSALRGDRRLPTGAYDAVQAAATVGAAIVLVGVVIALPAVWRFIRAGGWAHVRRPVARASIVCAATAVLTVGMVLWSHYSSHGNGGPVSHGVGSLWALLVAATIATCTGAAIVAAGRLRFHAPVLRCEGLLALALTLVMVAVIGGTFVWAIAVASHEPRTLWGSGSGLFGVPGPVADVVVGLLMVTGLILSTSGTRRVAGSIRTVVAD
jgi:hypothetical protein